MTGEQRTRLRALERQLQDAGYREIRSESGLDEDTSYSIKIAARRPGGDLVEIWVRTQPLPIDEMLSDVEQQVSQDSRIHRSSPDTSIS